MTKRAAKHESCVWPEGNDFIESCNRLSSSCDNNFEPSKATDETVSNTFVLGREARRCNLPHCQIMNVWNEFSQYLRCT